jgi:hypothetical protein
MQILSTFRFACLGVASVLDIFAGLGLGLLPERARVNKMLFISLKHCLLLFHNVFSSKTPFKFDSE